MGGSVGRNLGLVIALALLVVVGAVTAGDSFTSVENLLLVVRYASIIGVISIGMTFVIIAGGIDLSVGSVMGLATVVASLSAVQAAATQSSWISNRSTQIVVEPGFLGFTRANFIGVPVLIWIFVVVAAAGWFLLNRTTFGRRTVAIGGNREATRLAGIRVKRHIVAIYVLSGLTSGIAAVMMLGRTTAGTSTHGGLYELDAIAAVVVGGTLLIGGRGTIVGTVFGVLIFSTLTNVFVQNNLSTSVQQVAKGLIIVVAVLLQQRFAARGATRRR